jgi:hypothetical protein
MALEASLPGSLDDSSSILNATTKFIVVHGKSEVGWVEAETASRSSLLAGLRHVHGIDVDERKFIGFNGGVQSARHGISQLSW